VSSAQSSSGSRISLWNCNHFWSIGIHANFGDVFADGLATTQDASLLFIGDDFGTTDVTAVLDPDAG